MNTDAVREFLERQRQYNVDNEILPSETAVIERLLDSEDMERVFSELLEKNPGNWGRILRRVVSVAAFWNPERVAQTRDHLKRLKKLDAKIKKAAVALAGLLEERSRIENEGALTGGSTPLDWLEKCAPDIVEGLGDYWATKLPPPAALVRAIAKTAAPYHPADGITRAAIYLQKTDTDTPRAMLAALRGERADLSDAAIAEILNSSMDLKAPLEAYDIKRIRSRFPREISSKPIP